MVISDMLFLPNSWEPVQWLYLSSTHINAWVHGLQDMNDSIKVHFIDVIRKVGQEITHPVESDYLEMHNDGNMKC